MMLFYRLNPLNCQYIRIFFPLLHKFHFRQLPIIGNITKCLSHEYPMFFVSVHITSSDEAAL